MVRRITRFLWFTGWSGCAHRFPASGRGRPLLGGRGRSAPGDKNYNLPGKNVAIYLCNGAAAPLVLLLLAGGAAMPRTSIPSKEPVPAENPRTSHRRCPDGRYQFVERVQDCPLRQRRSRSGMRYQASLRAHFSRQLKLGPFVPACLCENRLIPRSAVWTSTPAWAVARAVFPKPAGRLSLISIAATRPCASAPPRR